jgi:two-component system sensor histidine kinase BaeS
VRTLSLRARVVAALVGVAALAALVAALLTTFALDRTFDRYLDRRVEGAAQGAVATASATLREDDGRWTRGGLDALAHELVLTGYDFRLLDGGRVLLDTTRLKRPGTQLRRVLTRDVPSPSGGAAGRLELYAVGGGGGTPADAEFRREFDRAHVLAAIAAAIVALVCGLFIAGRLTGPLRRLAVAARGLARGERMDVRAIGGPPEVRAIGEALEGLAGDLDRQDRARRQLAQDLAHELRTPLTLVQSRIEAMQDGVVEFDPDGLDALHTEVLRLARLIGQIERLAEAEAHPTPLTLGSFSLDQVATELHAALAGPFELRGLRLHLDARPAAALADVDATRQIAANLLSNALKYAPEGGEVTMRVRTSGGQATLEVRDLGAPLEPDEADRVFERFFRSPSARRTGGAGLGLTIARELAEAQGGSLGVETSARGNAFVLRLPAAVASPPPPARQASVRRAASR